MIYLHKILPIFFLPIGLTVVCIITGLLWRKRQLCWAGAILLWVSSTNWVGDFAMLAVEGSAVQPAVQEVPTAEAIVVLAGGRFKPVGNGLSQWTEPVVNRFEAGVELYLAGRAPLLLFTNGAVPWEGCYEAIESSVMRLAEKRGVPRHALVTTEKVRNTAEEARGVAKVLNKQSTAEKGGKIILVTSAFHMRRAALLFERAGFEVIPFPTDFWVCRKQQFSMMDLLPTAQGLKQTETALREWYGYLYYAFGHRIHRRTQKVIE